MRLNFIFLAAIIGFAAAAVLIGTLIFTGANMDYWDIGVYHGYANQTFSGQVPYVDFRIEYPQLALLTILPPYLPVLLTGNHDLFIPAHIVLFFGIYIGVIILTFLIAQKLYNRNRAYIAVIACILSPALLYYSLFKYDAFPALLLLASVYLFLQDSTKTYIMSALGFLTKLFPIIFLPFYIIHDIKNGLFKWKNIAIAIIAIAVITVPFFLLNPGNFIWTYWTHFNRGVQTESIWYLLHAVGIEIPNLITTFAAPAVILGLLYLHWRRGGNKESVIFYATIALYIFVMLNKVASPQYLLWVAPLLAILLSDDVPGLGFLLIVNTLMFVEYPMSIYTIFSPYEYIIVQQAIDFFIVKYIFWAILLLLLLRRLPKNA